jgi:hypothetical protein
LTDDAEPQREPLVMVRDLAVCFACYFRRNPDRVPTLVPIQHLECVDCEQAPGTIWVRMRIEWP